MGRKGAPPALRSAGARHCYRPAFFTENTYRYVEERNRVTVWNSVVASGSVAIGSFRADTIKAYYVLFL